MAKKINTVDVSGSPVYVGQGVFEELQEQLSSKLATKEVIFLLADENTIEHCYPLLISMVPQLEKANKIIIKSGEENKTLATCEKVWNQMAVEGANRQSLLVNLGGGVICDLGGFAASVFHRGMPFINIPTSLMAMIDASIGGKTGVDLYSLKNQIGLFSKPAGVYVWPGFLATLPHRQLLSGFAEMMKHALIADSGFWKKLTKIPMAVVSNWEDHILTAIKIKSKIVNLDPNEKGVRRQLNFGHTIGHAFETYSLRNDASPMTHGEAVAMGMICEAYISYRILGFNHLQRDELVKNILLNFSHYKIPTTAIDELVEITHYDKKNRKGRLMMTLIRDIGNAVDGQQCELALVRESLFRYIDFSRHVPRE
ncbi:MAG: 3-dehydroquinate synthase [Bacteroidales bacterium]|nr:3-dehydroquinate synthase [Bacteroidales bacterium]